MASHQIHWSEQTPTARHSVSLQLLCLFRRAGSVSFSKALWKNKMCCSINSPVTASYDIATHNLLYILKSDSEVVL